MPVGVNAAIDRPDAMSDEARIVIIGGGAIGLSVAYHLGKLGISDVLLVERNRLTSGTSWHAAGIVGPLRASLNMTKLALYATELFPALEAETGQATGYRRTGGFWLAQTPDRMTELRRIGAMGQRFGLEATMVGPEEIRAEAPFLETADLAGGLRVAEDGQVNPVDLCMAYAKGARSIGVLIEEGVGVEGIESRRGRVDAVVLSDGRRLRCRAVVNCAGLWGRQVGAMAGVAVPLQAVEHMYIVTEAMSELPDPVPILRDLDARIYLKGDAGKLVLGGFEPDAKCWDLESVEPGASFLEFDEDWAQFEPFMEAGLKRVPALEQTGIQHFMNGPEAFTPDTRQLMGEAPELGGFFVAAGFNSIGIMSSAGAGRALAEWVVAGEAPMDLWEVDIARHDRQAAAPAFLRARMGEAVANQLDMHWPAKQPRTGRGLRRSPLHHQFGVAGAVFGETAGWERPLWFAQGDDDRQIRYSYGSQNWWPMAKREASLMAEGVALFELSPFTKIDVTGPDALGLLQRLCANQIDVPVGRTVYTPLLNPRGGIEADVTVTRRGETDFRVVSGAATRRKDLAWITRALGGDERVGVFDATSGEAVVGVMGARSRDLLASLSRDDLSAAGFPFGTSREIDLAMARVRATRLSFVGELGWEIAIPAELAGHVFEALVDAGPAHGLGLAGHFCLDGCRLEKRFAHWGHDLGSELSPLAAGLGFTVAWDKGDFIGRDALLRQREEGVDRFLLLFEVAAGPHGPPLLLHDELVLADGVIAGLTTSGGLGPRTGKALAFGVVEARSGEAKADLLAKSYEIEVAGERHRAQPLRRPPYDPDGLRMRG